MDDRDHRDPRSYPDWLPLGLLIAFIILAGSVTFYLSRDDNARTAANNPSVTQTAPARPQPGPAASPPDPAR